MNRTIPFLLLALLIGSAFAVFGFYEWNQNQQLIQDKADLKAQLDKQASQLRAVEEEKHNLETQLNQTQSQVTQLEGKITRLEQNITDLRKELQDKREDLQMRTGAITIGLSFFWNPAFLIDTAWISPVIHRMNEVIWRDFTIYFFIYHAEPRDFIPKEYNCEQAIKGAKSDWPKHASQLYPGPDIPIGLFEQTGNGIAGCASLGDLGGDTPHVSVNSEFFYLPSMSMKASQLVSHELLHAMFSISDTTIDREMGSGLTDYIPFSWKQMIQVGAKQFQMPIPSDSS